jgi:hypothetical protein
LSIYIAALFNPALYLVIRYPLILLLTLFLSGIVQGQSLSVEATAGPSLAYRILVADENFKAVFGDERPIISYQGGLRLLYPFNINWSAGAGVAYTRKGFNLGPFYFTDEFGNPVNEIEPKIAYTYLEIPLFVRYVFKQTESYKLYVQSALAANFFLRERWLDAGKNSVTIENSLARPVNIGLQAGVGILFPLSGPWQIGVEPGLNTHLLPVFSDTPAKRWLFSFGINLLVNRTW